MEEQTTPPPAQEASVEGEPEGAPASPPQRVSSPPQPQMVELEVVLVRGHASEPWGLQLEYQLYRGHPGATAPESQWGCFAVVDTRPDSPAARDPALRIGDTIVGVDGKRVSAAKRDDFAELLSILHSKGRAVQLTVARQIRAPQQPRSHSRATMRACSSS